MRILSVDTRLKVEISTCTILVVAQEYQASRQTLKGYRRTLEVVFGVCVRVPPP